MYLCTAVSNNRLHRGVEQLVARRAHNPKVIGSSPVPATTKDSSVNFTDGSFFCPSVSLVISVTKENMGS